MFFENWHEFWRIFLTALIAYASLIFWLRIFGKRTLSKWNAFDFIVTIALGSVTATVILSKDLVILEGVFAFFLLVAFQFVITFLSSRTDFIDYIIKSKPTLLYYKGTFRKDIMLDQRVTRSEILAAIRNSSIGSLEKVEAVVLETDGEFSVIEKSDQNGDDSTLEDVDGFEKMTDRK